MDTPQEIGDRLQEARRRRALTQAELETASGVRRLTISRIERGQFEETPRPQTVRRLCEALGIEPGWLLYGDGEEGKAAA